MAKRRRQAKRTFKRRVKRRTGKRRLRRRRHKLPIGGFPKSKMVRFRYVEEININAGPGAVSANVFSANGMYDPNITGIGHQPSNFDVWISTNGIYDHYCVLGSKITVTPTFAASEPSPNAYVGILKSDNGTRASTMQVVDIMEQKLCRYSRVTTGLDNPGLGPIRQSQVRATFSASKFFGKPKSAILGDDQYRGDLANNPGEQAYFEVWCGSVNGTDPTSKSLLVEIEYIAILSEPRPNVAS